METAFGHDFSRVRVHSGDTTALPERLGARAFTVGEHILFGRSEYNPGTPIGDALLATSFAHVVQQEGDHTAGSSCVRRRARP